MSEEQTKTYDFGGKGDLLESVELSQLMPSPTSDTEAHEPTVEDVRAVAEKVGWKSREGKTLKRKKTPPRKRRSYRTGRNEQFNTRCDPKVIQGFYDIADEMQIQTMGETLERALAALKREHEAQKTETTATAQAG